jgi:hypothetical protein
MVRQTDAAGNASGPATLNFTIESLIPPALQPQESSAATLWDCQPHRFSHLKYLFPRPIFCTPNRPTPLRKTKHFSGRRVLWNMGCRPFFPSSI